MANYYELLKVSPKASSAEIKSAYRKLARKLHPDRNDGSAETTREFRRITRAYEVIGDPKKRAEYDHHRLQAQFRGSTNGSSVFASENQHAKRIRQMVYEKRYNEIIDRMIADERRESIALQKIIFPIVALFLTTFVVAVFRPTFFSGAAIIGKILIISLSVSGLIHLAGRLRDALDRYTYAHENIHDSILEETEPESKPFSRFTAVAFVVLGFCLSLGAGMAVGNYLEFLIPTASPAVFGRTFEPEMLFYPPIVVLFVDLMHSFASRAE